MKSATDVFVNITLKGTKENDGLEIRGGILDKDILEETKNLF